MAFISKDKLQNLMERRPPGTNPREIIERLIDKGYEIEGLNPSAYQANNLRKDAREFKRTGEIPKNTLEGGWKTDSVEGAELPRGHSYQEMMEASPFAREERRKSLEKQKNLMADTGAIVENFVSGYTANISGAISQAMGREKIEPRTKMGKVLSIASGIAGFATGIPGKVFGTVQGAMESITTSNVLRWAIPGLTVGVLHTDRKDPFNLKKRLGTGAMSGTISALFGASQSTLRGILKFLQSPSGTKYLPTIRKAYDKVSKAVSDTFETSLKKISKEVPKFDIGEQLDVLQMRSKHSPLLRRAIRQSRPLRFLMKRKKVTPLIEGGGKKVPLKVEYVRPMKSKVTLEKSQQIYNQLQKFVRGTAKDPNKVTSRLNEQEKELIFKVINKIREKQMQAVDEAVVKGAFKSNVLKPYADKINDINYIRKYMSRGQTEKLLEGWQGKEVKDAMKNILPRKVVQEIGGYQNIYGLLNFGKMLGKYALYYYGAKSIFSEVGEKIKGK